MKLGVCFGWHANPWEELLALVQRAEALGYAAVYVDGDTSMLSERHEADVLDGWTVTTALLARTARIQIGSLRLAHHWNAARLAQAVATAERLTPGRLRFLISVGDRAIDARFGLPRPSPAERIGALDELLTAIRALWRGESVTMRGHHVQLDAARVRPVPPGGRIPIEIAAKGPRMLGVVAAHADLWEVNLPPIPHRVGRVAALLEAACGERGRDPGEIARSMRIFTRIEPPAGLAAALREYRRLSPWFDGIPDSEIRASLVVGSPAECRERLDGMARELRLDLPLVDLSGLHGEAAATLLEALAPRA